MIDVIHDYEFYNDEFLNNRNTLHGKLGYHYYKKDGVYYVSCRNPLTSERGYLYFTCDKKTMVKVRKMRLVYTFQEIKMWVTRTSKLEALDD